MVTQLEPAGVVTRRGRPPVMGYQPALDGLRAVSVAVVILYHAHVLGAAGLGFAKGGFLGVEVFFVVSGYLITALLLEERHRTGRIDVKRFWARRARRLLPALFVMLGVVTVWAALWRTDTLARLRHDVPGALFYVSNWQQIGTKQGYFAALETPPLLRHLWSLAVEEQWYVLWPLAFTALMRRVRGHARAARLPIAAAAAAAMLAMAVLYQPDPARINLVYLGTFTRAGGLLVGALLATGWTPWAWPAAARRHLVALDAIGFMALAGLALAVVTLGNGSAVVYRGGLAAVSLLSAVAIAAATHPGARWLHAALSRPWLAAVGRRSYGLYLWHWPVFVLLRAGRGGGRLVLALVVSVAAAEACYRFVEQPVRRGALARWWGQLRIGSPTRRRAVLTAAVPLALLVPFGVRVATATAPDAARDPGADVAFATTTEPAAVGAGDTTATTATTAGAAVAAGEPPTAAPEVPTTLPSPPPPTRVVLVGDSQAHSLYINQPPGLGSVLALSDGAVEGCGLFDNGTLQSVRPGWSKGVSDCKGWPAKWGQAVRTANAQVALVMLGAWDVFDLRQTSAWLVFASEPHDAEIRARLGEGIAAVRAAGARVALLEVPCMRPVETTRSPVPALPERGDDRRVAHLNDLLRESAAADPADVFFVPGPAAWCQDPTVATDLSYRWDGVHVYKPGAKLVLETIAPALTAIATAT